MHCQNQYTATPRMESQDQIPGGAVHITLAIMRFLILIGAALLASTPGNPALAQRIQAPSKVDGILHLQPYIRCDGFAEGVRGVKLDSRPKDAEPWREVSVGSTKRRVSVIHGYRVMYAYPGTDFFANLKAEQSDPAKYGEDKATLKLSLSEIGRAEGTADVKDFTIEGVVGQTLTKRALTGRTAGISQLFFDQDSVIVTIYFLNQAPEKRKFKTYEEFIPLRDKFVAGYADCVVKKRLKPLLLQ